MYRLHLLIRFSSLGIEVEKLSEYLIRGGEGLLNVAQIVDSKSLQLLHIRLHFETCVDYTYKWNNIFKLLIFADGVVLCFEKMGKKKIMQQVDNDRWDLFYLFVVAQIYQLYTAGQLNTVNNCTQLDYWIQSTVVHNWKTEYCQLLNATGQLNTVNKHTHLNNWIQSTTVHNWTTNEQLNTLNKCIQQYSQQPYRTGQLNTVNNC